MAPIRKICFPGNQTKQENGGIKLKRPWINRLILYLCGLLILALGLSLNTKSGLGVTAIISVAYSISQITGFNFGNTTLGLYTFFVVLEIIIHLILSRRIKTEENPALVHLRRKRFRSVLLMDILQIPLSIIFTRFLNVFADILPDYTAYQGSAGVQWVIRFCILLIAIICTGVGAAMSLNMRIIPNPGDGIVQAISDISGKSVGFTKNCVDLVNILISCCIGFFCVGHLAGVGIGTVFAVIFVGRVIALFNHFFFHRMVNCAGLEKHI